MTRRDDWPHTGRVLPWLLAVFLCEVWLVPAEAIQLPIPLPVEAHPDRFVLLALVVVALVSVVGRRSYAYSSPAVGVSLALLGLAAVSILSLALNAAVLAGLGELSLGIKQIAILLSIAGLFFVIATVVRPSEVPRYVTLMIVLATVTAIGTIWEYRTGYNVFFDLAAKLFGGFAAVKPPPVASVDSRAETLGPTQHGLAIVTMLTLVLPFAVLRLGAARRPSHKMLYGLAASLMFAAAVSTGRKTSIVGPAAAMLVLVAFRPRQMLRLVPLAVVLVAAVHVLAPSALGGVGAQLTGGFLNSSSSVGRTSDYAAVAPDIATYPLLGRGYGSVDPTRADTYRILDNQYLDALVQTGYVGLAAHLALLVVAMALAFRTSRTAHDPELRLLGLAAVAGCFAFIVVNALFDAFSFLQGPYLFIVIAGFCSVAAAPAPLPLRAPVRLRLSLS